MGSICIRKKVDRTLEEMDSTQEEIKRTVHTKKSYGQNTGGNHVDNRKEQSRVPDQSGVSQT